jgi:hypothetical protein
MSIKSAKIIRWEHDFGREIESLAEWALGHLAALRDVT